MWFDQAAAKIIKEYDVPNDHDGPRHFEHGLGLMVMEMLYLIDARRGRASAEKTAERISMFVNQWMRTKDVEYLEDK